MNKLLLALLGGVGALVYFAIQKAPTDFFLVQGFKSFLGLKNKPKAVANNNPGNIRISASKWQGKVPVPQNTDGSFEQFVQYRYGVRALIKLLLKYKRDGRDTIAKIIERYAPQTENPTGSYISFVERQTGFGRNRVLVLTPAVLEKLVIAITQFESGEVTITTEDFAEGLAIV